MWSSVYSGYPAYPMPAAAPMMPSGWTGQYHLSCWPQAGTAYTGMAGHDHASSLNAAGGHKRAHPAEPYSMAPAVPAYAMPRAVPVTAPAAYALAAVSKQQLDATKHATKPGS